MKKTQILLKPGILWLTLFCCMMFQQTACAQDTKPFSINESPLPAPTGFVNDYAGVIDTDTKQSLEARIKAFKESTNPQVELAVAIVRTTGERPIFDYSIAVARGWKIGSKEDDNPGALLLIAIDDRKYFTQVSRNLEDELPDGVVGQLQRQNLVPAFKKGDYGKGVSDTIDAYIRTIKAKQSGESGVAPPDAQTDKGNEKKNSNRGGGLPFGNCMTCLIILFIILIIIFSRGGGGSGGRRNRSRWGGGGFGGSALPWIIGSAIANSSSSGSGWGSSSSSSSDGGFGGFGGGGDFGGGGSGGDW